MPAIGRLLYLVMGKHLFNPCGPLVLQVQGFPGYVRQAAFDIGDVRTASIGFIRRWGGLYHYGYPLNVGMVKRFPQIKFV